MTRVLPDAPPVRPPLRVAVRGMLAEGAGSSAGSFHALLQGLLERGHRVDYFANPSFLRPRAFERFPGYRFWPLRFEPIEVAWELAASLPLPHPRAAVAQLAFLSYERAAVHRIEQVHREAPFDAVLCTDMQALWPSRLPVMSWPQSPPHTEAAALALPAVRSLAVRQWGRAHYAAARAFYVYRELVARAALRSSARYLTASRWARDEWIRFGVDPAMVKLIPFPIELEAFRDAPPPGEGHPPTFLWLGRAVPRKRFDLFLAAFCLVSQRKPGVRARLVGNLEHDPFAAHLLAEYRALPGLSVEPPVPRSAVPALLAEVDVLVQPSQYENFGFSVAEALAAGRPVVAGPTNGTFEYAGAAGFAFETHTPESVAHAMERALAAARSDGAAIAQRAREAAAPLALDAVIARFSELVAELNAEASAGARP